MTFVKYWAPSCLAWLDIPFIWGPVGGGESLPQGFSSECSLKGRIYELLRSLARFLENWTRMYDLLHNEQVSVYLQLVRVLSG